MSDPELEPLESEFSSLLDDERHAPEAPTQSKAAVIARVTATVAAVGAAGAATGAAVSVSTSSGAKSALSTWFGTKAVVASIALTTTFVGTAWLTHAALKGDAPAETRAHQAQAATITPAAPQRETSEQAAPVVAPPSAATTPEVAAQPSVARRTLPAARTEASAPIVAVQSQNAVSEEEEHALLLRAGAALRRHQADQALAALAEYRAQFSSPRFSEEHDALEIRALVAADRIEEARVKKAQFFARHDRSLFGAAIRAALPDDPQE